MLGHSTEANPISINIIISGETNPMRSYRSYHMPIIHPLCQNTATKATIVSHIIPYYPIILGYSRMIVRWSNMLLPCPMWVKSRIFWWCISRYIFFWPVISNEFLVKSPNHTIGYIIPLLTNCLTSMTPLLSPYLGFAYGIQEKTRKEPHRFPK